MDGKVWMEICVSGASDVHEVLLGYTLDLDGKCDSVEILDSNGIGNMPLCSCEKNEIMAGIDEYLESQKEETNK